MAEKPSSRLSWRGGKSKTTRDAQTDNSRETRRMPMYTTISRREIGKFRPVIAEFASEPRLSREFHAAGIATAAPDQQLLEALQSIAASLAGTTRDAFLVALQTPHGQEWDRMVTSFAQEHRTSEYGTVIVRLFEAASNTDPEELHPTEYAVTGLTELLAGVPPLLRGAFPRGAVAVDEDGALHIYWRNGTKRLELGYPANAPDAPYLYAYEGGAGALHQRASSQDVAAYLDRLTAV